jgi:hypothetical protein
LAGTPFFITGTGRSGSTYLYHLLRAHPRIAITNEARILDALWRSYQSVAIPYGQTTPDGIRGVVNPETLPLLGDVFCAYVLAMMEEYYRRRFGDRFTHFGDKLPDYCAVGMAAAAAPEIRVIMMVRDPRDVVCSYRAVRDRDSAGLPREADLKSFSVLDLSRIWRDTYEFLLSTVPRIHWVPYEGLVRQPAEVVRGVLDHLGLNFDPAILAEIESNASFQSHGSSESAEASAGRWRRELSSDAEQQVVEVCGQVMSRLGLAENSAQGRSR